MPRDPFVSTAARAEDVVLLRALGHLPAARVVEVTPDGAPGVTRSLAALGWDAVAVTADDVAAALDADAPVHALVLTAATGPTVQDVLGARVRPWVVVTAGTGDAPDGPLTAAGYAPALFDGASWWYVAPGHAALLLPEEGTSPGDAQEDAARWRSLAVDGWAQAVAELGPARRGTEIQHAEAEAMRATLSWRITAPPRAARGWFPR